MKFHFLVTISDDVRLLFGVRFVCSFFSRLEIDHKVTLLHIRSVNKNDMSLALGNMWLRPEADEDAQLSARAKRAINASRELLLTRNMGEDRVLTKTTAEQYGKAEDILKEGLFGNYDAIILGRRASYSLQWMFENPADETARAIIRRLCYVPVWVCPELDPDRKNLLLCLDGSDNCYRAADHVGYILAPESQHSVTLFHVQSSDVDRSTDIFKHAESILRGHGIAGTRIKWKSGRGRDAAKTIQSEIDAGNYAAVALGLHGEQEDAAGDQKMAGSTLTRIIHRMEKAAIWCCP